MLFLSSFYYIGHFSHLGTRFTSLPGDATRRYVAPGAERIAVASSRDRLKAAGFRNPDGTAVVVVLNQAGPWPPAYDLVQGRLRDPLLAAGGWLDS